MSLLPATTVDLSGRGFTFLVGALNLTEYVAQFLLQRDPADMSAPALWRLQCVIKDNFYDPLPESLNPRLNTQNRWLRGAYACTLTIRNSQNVSRTISSNLRIVKATYQDWSSDPFLQLELTDQLGILSYASDAFYGDYSPATYLQTLGGSVDSSVSSSYVQPIRKDTGDGIPLACELQFAASLRSNRRPGFLYTKSNGDIAVVVWPTTKAVALFRLSISAVSDFSLAESGEELPDFVTASSAVEILLTPENVGSEISFEYTTLGLLRDNDSTQRKLRRITKTIFDSFGQVTMVIIKEPATVVFKGATDSTAMIISSVVDFTYTYDQNDVLTAKVSRDQRKRGSFTGEVLSTGTTITTRETWEYDSNYVLTRYRRIVNSPSIVVTNIDNHTAFLTRDIEETIETYSVKGSRYRKRRIERKAEGLVDPDTATPTELFTVKDERSFDAPPAPTKKPAPQTTTQVQITESVELQYASLTPFKDRDLQITVNYLYSGDYDEATGSLFTAQRQLEDAARWKGQEITGYVFARKVECPIPDAWLLNPRPYQVADVRSERLIVTSETVTYDESGRLSFGFVGLFLGRLASPVPDPPYTGPRISVGGGLSITPVADFTLIQGVAIQPLQLSATGGTPPYTFSVVGLNAGLSLSAAGLLTGTPTTVGSATPTFTVTDSLLATSNDGATITVTANPNSTPFVTPVITVRAKIGISAAIRYNTPITLETVAAKIGLRSAILDLCDPITLIETQTSWDPYCWMDIIVFG